MKRSCCSQSQRSTKVKNFFKLFFNFTCNHSLKSFATVVKLFKRLNFLISVSDVVKQ